MENEFEKGMEYAENYFNEIVKYDCEQDVDNFISDLWEMTASMILGVTFYVNQRLESDSDAPESEEERTLLFMQATVNETIEGLKDEPFMETLRLYNI